MKQTAHARSLADTYESLKTAEMKVHKNRSGYVAWGDKRLG